jgi:Domain of unknown function (DUF4314)
VPLDRVTVTDRMEELEGCDPDAQGRLAHQPAWPLASVIDPANPAVEVGLDDTSVGSLGQGAQLGHLPDPTGHQRSWQPPDQQGATMDFTPGDRVELVATNDPYTRLRPGDRGTVTSIADRPEPTIDIAWDNGSTLAILPDAGDRIRLLPSDDADPSPSSPAMPEAPTQPRYPEVQVQLSGEDGNAFAILGRTAAALRAAGVPSEEIDAFFAEATSGDYDHLLHTTMAWVDWD